MWIVCFLSVFFSFCEEESVEHITTVHTKGYAEHIMDFPGTNWKITTYIGLVISTSASCPPKGSNSGQNKAIFMIFIL